MLGPLDGHRPQGLPSSLHRRRLGPLVCLVISILLVWSLVRFDPHTNAAVGKAGERLAEGWRDRYKAGLDGGWDAWKAATKGWAGAVAPAAGGLEGPETGQMVDAPPAGWRQGKPLAEGADLEGCREPTPPKLPTTKLGRVADRVYDSIGTLCLDTYRSELETFLLAHFPSPAANLSDPGSLYSLLRSYLNATLVTLPPSSPLRENLSGPGIPKKIHQTNRLKEYRPAYLLSTQVWDPWSWEQKNPDWEYEMVVDSDADSWVRKTFSEPRAQPPSSGKLRLDDPPSSRSGVVDAWDRMASTPVMRSDFWRYLRLLSLGGTYSDMDTRCLKPIAEWTRWGGAPAGADGDWAAGKATGEPSVVVGIEADVGNREDWHECASLSSFAIASVVTPRTVRADGGRDRSRSFNGPCQRRPGIRSSSTRSAGSWAPSPRSERACFHRTPTPTGREGRTRNTSCRSSS